MNAWIEQQERNRQWVERSRYMRPRVVSQVLPLHVDLATTAKLDRAQVHALGGLQVDAARIAIRSLASLAKIGELDHLGGGLDLIPAFSVTLAVTDWDKVHYTFEHAHTSIGYYSLLAAWGFLDEAAVVDGFRRGLDIPGHVSWVPGGTELNGGRLGVMVPAATGQALGVKAVKGDGAFVICHCGDAGWISGQALNGFNAADLHRAPIAFVMHRNGIQLSGTNKAIMDKDPRPIIASLGIEILEIPSLLDPKKLYAAYREAFQLAGQGRPSLIYPTGFRSRRLRKVTLRSFAADHGIAAELEAFAAKHQVNVDTEVWVPGSLMSYRDVKPMLECLFLVNGLPGGEGHHDGHMKGRSEADVLAHPMMQKTPAQARALKRLAKQPKREVATEARPAPGAPNLLLSTEDAAAAGAGLPGPGKAVSPRAGSEAGYAAVAKAFPDLVFVVSCDLDPSTKLGKARGLLKRDHQFEVSIEEQLATMLCNGLAVSSRRPQLNVVSTFAAFFEGIAREGFEMWRYQRNLTGANEGLNVCFHLSHVGSCTGRDHFSGWSLDWITLAMGYLPYLDRFYAPADARAAFLAVRDLASRYGGHIIGIPRDNLPVLEKQGTAEPLWSPAEAWAPATPYRAFPGARKAILALGAPAYLAGKAADELAAAGEPVDVHVVNGLPLPDDFLPGVFAKYPGGVVTVEDGIIATKDRGLRGFAGLVCSAASGTGVRTEHVGIVDPRIAPSEGHVETWDFFGINAAALVAATKRLA